MEKETTGNVEKQEDVNEEIKDVTSDEIIPNKKVGGEIPEDDDEEGQPPA